MRKSIRYKLVLSFIVTSIIPIIILNLFSYYNTSKILIENNNTLTEYNLEQTCSSMNAYLEPYEDMLYQIYANDEIIKLVNSINAEENPAVDKNQLRRALRGYFYTKEYIKSISIITEKGEWIFYDSITGSTTHTSWLEGLGMDWKELYDAIAEEKGTYVIPTRKADTIANEDNYLFHFGHKIVDYNQQNQRIGVLVISIDERLLEKVCGGEDAGMTTYHFIADQNGNVISAPDKARIGEWLADGQEKREKYLSFAAGQSDASGKEWIVNYIYDEKWNWDIVNVSDQNEVMHKLEMQQRITLVVLGVSVLILLVIIALLTNDLTGAIKKVVKVMQSVEAGESDARVDVDDTMPYELEIIGKQYNDTMDKLMDSVEKEKELNRKKKDAEIMALEAQINPHFLYNTLDTINWMAIGKGEFEISNAITALAAILRYGIDNSNGIVTIQEELEWLRQYLLLQQTRLKMELEHNVMAEASDMEIKIHKLLMQPFVENAIIHGLKGIQRKCVLNIAIKRISEELLSIEIYDNGNGMEEELVADANQGVFPETTKKNHIGLKNAYNRIRLYYGEQAEVRFESKLNEYTKVCIVIPIDKAEEVQEI